MNKFFFYCHLLIHEASSNVAEIPSVPRTTEYISVDDKPVNDPDTTEDSEATMAQRTLFRSYQEQFYFRSLSALLLKYEF